MQAELSDAQQHSSELRAQLLALQGAAAGEQRVQLALRVGADGGGGDAAATERLQQAEAEVERLRQQLADLQPVRMQLSLLDAGGSSSAGGSPLDLAGLPPSVSRRTTRRSLDASASPGAAGEHSLLAREASDGSMAGLAYGSDQAASELSRARAAADAAWREHQKVGGGGACRRGCLSGLHWQGRDLRQRDAASSHTLSDLAQWLLRVCCVVLVLCAGLRCALPAACQG